ncbi:MAG: hypothetical protein WC222_10600 [Parachlamydiales bacterium]|jgi:hypothetical protein
MGDNLSVQSHSAEPLSLPPQTQTPNTVTANGHTFADQTGKNEKLSGTMEQLTVGSESDKFTQSKTPRGNSLTNSGAHIQKQAVNADHSTSQRSLPMERTPSTTALVETAAVDPKQTKLENTIKEVLETEKTLNKNMKNLSTLLKNSIKELENPKSSLNQKLQAFNNNNRNIKGFKPITIKDFKDSLEISENVAKVSDKALAGTETSPEKILSNLNEHNEEYFAALEHGSINYNGGLEKFLGAVPEEANKLQLTPQDTYGVKTALLNPLQRGSRLGLFTKQLNEDTSNEHTLKATISALNTFVSLAMSKQNQIKGQKDDLPNVEKFTKLNSELTAISKKIAKEGITSKNLKEFTKIREEMRNTKFSQYTDVSNLKNEARNTVGSVYVMNIRNLIAQETKNTSNKPLSSKDIEKKTVVAQSLNQQIKYLESLNNPAMDSDIKEAKAIYEVINSKIQKK